MGNGRSEYLLLVVWNLLCKMITLNSGASWKCDEAATTSRVGD